MGNRKSSSYRGPLTPQQVADGMNTVGRNARRLHEDAKMMLEAKRYASACSLAALSVEEAGKIPILRRLACAKGKHAVNASWRSFGDHCEKNAHWIFADEVGKGARTLLEFNKLYDRGSNHPTVLNMLKQIGLYVDCYGDAHWSEPEAVIDENAATVLVRISGVMLPKKDVTVREVELWVLHLGDDLNNRMAVGKYYAYEKALIEEGLSDHKLGDIERFLGIGGTP